LNDGKPNLVYGLFSRQIRRLITNPILQECNGNSIMNFFLLFVYISH